MNKKIFLKIALRSVFTLFFCLLFLVLIPYQNVKAAGTSPVEGTTAIIANTGGYIYFDAGTYGSNVVIDDVTREFSGYAWSNDLGWIDFGIIDNPTYGPVVKAVDGDLSGKAKALSGGYIDFNASPTGANVTISALGVFSGFAWSDDLGWIDFNGVTSTPSDTEAPTGGSIFYGAGYTTVASVSLTVDDGTDTGSGINTASRTVQRKSATLSAGTCDTFGSFAAISPTGTYPNLVDATVASGNCYQYQYMVQDNATNQATYTLPSQIQVDTSTPSAPGVPSTTTPTNSGSQTWTWTAATDAVSGIAGYLWRTTGTAIESGWTTTNSVITSLAEGVYSFFIKARDNASNEGSEATAGTVTVDQTGPTTTDSGIDGNWHNTGVTVTLTCDDNGGSGCANTYYTTDGSTPTSGSSSGTSFTISASGTYTIKYFSVDILGAEETVKTAANQVKIEQVAPATGSINYTDGYITTASVGLTVSDGTDAISGINIASRTVQRKSATLSAGTCGVYGAYGTVTPSGTYPSLTDTTVATGNCYQYQYLVQDNATNQATYTSSSVVKVDTGAPTTGSITYTNGYTTSTSVSLTVADGTDAVSGVNTATRVVQRKSATLSAGTCGAYGSFGAISPTGTYPDLTDATTTTGNCYQYQYMVQDNVTNQATYTNSNVVKVDTGAPATGSITYTNGYTTSTSISLTVADGTDSVSGINTSSRTVQRKSATLSAGICGSYGAYGTISPTGTYPDLTDSTTATGNCYQYQYLTQDNATNQATYTNSNVIKVDTGAPATGSITYTDGYVTTTSVSLTASDGTDAISGVNTATRVVQRKSATFSADTCGVYGSFNTISQTGTYPNFTDATLATGNCYQYQYTVQDNATNSVTYTSANVLKIDTGNPSTPGVPSTTTPTSSGSQSWSWSAATDAVSGIASYLWRTTGTAITNGVVYTNSVITSLAQGIYSFFVKSVDNAGNQSSETAAGTVTVDQTGPTTTDSGIDGNWHNTGVTVTLTCNDNGGSSCANTYYTTDGNAPTSGSSSGNSFTISASGTYTIKYFSVDALGTEETVKTAANQVKIEQVAPSTGSITYTDGYITTASVGLTVTDGIDATSGINTASRTVQRKSATLSAGTCGAYGSFATVTPTGTYPSLTDTTVATGNCYQYQYLVRDNATNQATYTSSSVIKVDTGAPTTGSIAYTDGYTTSTSVSLTVADGTDVVSGVNTDTRTIQRKSATLSAGTCGAYGSFGAISPTGTYPDLTDATVVSGNCYQYQYMVQDNVTNQAIYTNSNVVKVDTGAPATGSVTYTDGYITTASVTLTVTDGTDAVSGINTSSRTVQRKSATLIDGICGIYGAYGTISHTGTYPSLIDTTLAEGNCYQYQYIVQDSATNSVTYTSSNVLMVETIIVTYSSSKHKNVVLVAPTVTPTTGSTATTSDTPTITDTVVSHLARVASNLGTTQDQALVDFNFTFPSSVVVGTSATFEAPTLVGENKIVKQVWTLGDGTRSEIAKTDYQYQTPGRYTVSLVVTDSTGQTAAKEQTIEVIPSQPIVESVEFVAGDLVITGKSFPKTIINLEIHSDPLIVQTNTDENGFWTYKLVSVKNTLEAGDHTVSASAAYVLSDKTQLKSDLSEPYGFKVTKDQGKVISGLNSRTWQIALGVLIVVAVIGSIYFMRRKRSER